MCRSISTTMQRQRHPAKRSAAGERAAKLTIALETNADGAPTMSLTFAGTTSTMTTDTGGSLGALFDYQNDVLTPLTDTIRQHHPVCRCGDNELAQGYASQPVTPGEPLFIYDASNADGPLTVNPDITADELGVLQFAGLKREQRQPAGVIKHPHRTAGDRQPRQRDGRAGVLVNHQQYRHLQSAKPDGSRCRVQCLFRSAKPAEQRQRCQHGRRGGEPHHLSTNL